MFGDLYSTFTLGGVYEIAVRAARDSSDRGRWLNPEEREAQRAAPVRPSRFARLGAWVTAHLHSRSTKGPQPSHGAPAA